MRGRPKKHETLKGKVKTIVLSDPAAKILMEWRRTCKSNRVTWDFSEWVSRKLIKEFVQDKHAHLKSQIYELQMERDKKNDEYNSRLQAMASQLYTLNDKKHQRKLENYVEVENDNN
jgi:hypothetical protein